MWADPEVTRYIGGRPFGVEEVWTRLLRYAGHWALLGYGYWAVIEKSSGRFVGEAGLADFHRGEVATRRRFDDRERPRLHDEPLGQPPPQQVRDVGMSTILGKCQQRFLKRIAAVGGVRAAIEQELGDHEMPLANREVDWRRVVVLDRRDGWRARGEPFDRAQVAVARGDEHGVDVVARDHRSIVERP